MYNTGMVLAADHSVQTDRLNVNDMNNMMEIIFRHTSIWYTITNQGLI